jgi:hypothetical protein
LRRLIRPIMTLVLVLVVRCLPCEAQRYVEEGVEQPTVAAWVSTPLEESTPAAIATLSAIPSKTPAPLVIVARDGPFGARTLFQGANSGYSEVADSALCLHAATYTKAARIPQNCPDYKCENLDNPPLGSVADTNLRKACELRLNGAEQSCPVARVRYQVIKASTGVYDSPRDNWAWSWSAIANTWYRVRADGAKIFKWSGTAWNAVDPAIAEADGVPRDCNGWVWTGYGDEVTCRCDDG